MAIRWNDRNYNIYSWPNNVYNLFDLFFDDDYESMKQIAIIMFASIPFIYVSSHLINTFIYPFNNEYF